MAYLANPQEVSIGVNTIPAYLLSEVNVELTQGTRERETLAGKFSRNAGTIDTAQATFTLFLESIDDLKKIVPGQYNEGTTPQVSGNVTWAANVCNVTNVPFNIHDTCATNDDNDIYFPNASIVLNFNPTFNASDEVTVECMAYANPDENGLVARLGTGNLTAESVFNPTTGATTTV